MKIEKIADIYKDKFANSNYGNRLHGDGAIGFIVNNLKPKSLLDVGCGRNQFSKIMKLVFNIEAIGCDLACESADIICSAHKLPFDNKSYDVVTSFDCLEHLPENLVETAIQEMIRVGKKAIVLSIGTNKGKIYNNLRLHLTVHPIDWWIALLSKYIKIQRRDKYLWGYIN